VTVNVATVSPPDAPFVVPPLPPPPAAPKRVNVADVTPVGTVHELAEPMYEHVTTAVPEVTTGDPHAVAAPAGTLPSTSGMHVANTRPNAVSPCIFRIEFSQKD
jgi:hypothetical protein